MFLKRSYEIFSFFIDDIFHFTILQWRRSCILLANLDLPLYTSVTLYQFDTGRARTRREDRKRPKGAKRLGGAEQRTLARQKEDSKSDLFS